MKRRGKELTKAQQEKKNKWSSYLAFPVLVPAPAAVGANAAAVATAAAVFVAVE